MATYAQNSSDQSMSELVSGIVEDVGHLITQQVKLTRAEIKDDFEKAGGIALTLAAGAGVMALAVILVALMLVFLIHWLTAPTNTDPATFPLWACFGAVGAGFGLIGAAMLAAGVSKYKSTSLMPEKSAQALKENVECLANNN
jgi:uncharacterized membrane protein YqjE